MPSIKSKFKSMTTGFSGQRRNKSFVQKPPESTGRSLLDLPAEIVILIVDAYVNQLRLDDLVLDFFTKLDIALSKYTLSSVYSRGTTRLASEMRRCKAEFWHRVWRENHLHEVNRFFQFHVYRRLMEDVDELMEAYFMDCFDSWVGTLGYRSWNAASLFNSVGLTGYKTSPTITWWSFRWKQNPPMPFVVQPGAYDEPVDAEEEKDSQSLKLVPRSAAVKTSKRRMRRAGNRRIDVFEAMQPLQLETPGLMMARARRQALQIGLIGNAY